MHVNIPKALRTHRSWVHAQRLRRNFRRRRFALELTPQPRSLVAAILNGAERKGNK